MRPPLDSRYANMSRDLINLLPPEMTRRFRREYFLRVATVALFMLTIVVVIHGIFLLPSYLEAMSQVKIATAELASATAAASTNTSNAAAQLATLKADTAYLARFGTVPSAAGAVRVVLSIPHPGITIQSITYQPPSGTNAASAKVVLSGTAATRDGLRSYDLALTGAPFISNVDLPISAYAHESDIDFSVTLTGTFTP